MLIYGLFGLLGCQCKLKTRFCPLICPLPPDKIPKKQSLHNRMFAVTDKATEEDTMEGASGNEHLYFVCVHYVLNSPREWEWKFKRLTVHYDRFLPRLANDLCYLRRVLGSRRDADGQTWQGFAFVFLDPGWTRLLGGSKPVGLAALGADLSTWTTQLEKLLAENPQINNSKEPRRERIVTSANLVYLLQLLDEAAHGGGDSFYRLFVGGAQTLRYDAPKVIEAAIRIANIGRGIPLFRFDDDVIFYGQRSPELTSQQQRDAAADSTATNILRLCKRYQDTLKDSSVRYFVFSGCYEAPPEEKIENCPNNDPRLLNGFATRVLQLTQLPETRPPDEDSKPGVIYSRDVNAFLRTVVELGANPFRQVVSGAGLCLSDGAILDLPPYSNMHLNVMWIDDHLKYALHDELGHFGRWVRTHHHHSARVSEAQFPQLRHTRRDGGPLFTYKDVKWHIKIYMQRLLLGCAADAWLRGKPEVKKSTRSLAEDAYKTLVESVPHSYGETFMEVLPGGWGLLPGKPTVDQFREMLWEQAVERLEKAVSYWGTDDYKDTFLGLFARGYAHPLYQDFKDVFPVGMPEGLKKAVEKLPRQCKDAKRPPEGMPDDPGLEQALATLVDDFVEYMGLVQFWPFFVQSVRSFQNQHAQYRHPHLEWMFPIT
jgi:hypothetical protein